ncbi:MAG: glucose 1-dehydrogenase [Planctomycetes bacterium]|nr:glucose 1-dehydrogenase [Planctomycetota bacterium]MBI3847603.1 glucose 1-dehydrogenase [Planctomycetota bacterium]
MTRGTEELRRLFDLDGKVAAVTGAGSGIGSAIAHGLAAFGARVVVSDVDSKAAEATVAALPADRAAAVRCDVTRGEDLDALVETAVRRFGRLDVLVNNAGVSAIAPAESTPRNVIDRMIDVNLKGTIFGCQSAARHFIERGGGGSILNLASIAGVVADPGSAPYAAAKGGVVQLTRTLAVEWGRHRIRVNAIGPNYTRTPLVRSTLADPEKLAWIESRTPLGRIGEPDDMIGAAVFLASDASAYVTGHVLMVDGGWSVW